MVHILDSLTRLENKFDTLTLASPGHQNAFNVFKKSSQPSIPDASKNNKKNNNHDYQHEFPRELQKTYQHLTVPHKIILWPSIYLHLVNTGISATSDLQYVLQEGTPWFIRQEMAKHTQTLGSEKALPWFPMNANLREQGYSSNVAFPTLTIQQIQEQCDAYFNTFNVLFPLLNRDTFMNQTVAPLLRDGYADGDVSAVLALLVFALGQVAIEGVFERPIAYIDGQPSGFRGGSANEPPGIATFNEARRRIGFVQTQSTLETVQMLLLEATYYESTARHLDFWRCTVAASMSCLVLVKCKSFDWFSQTGDLVKRAYWTCMLSEDFYHLDLDLPRTGIDELENEVPLPYFHEAHYQQGSPGPLSEERSHFQYHFLAMIALRKLISSINDTIHQSEYAWSFSAFGPPTNVNRYVRSRTRGRLWRPSDTCHTGTRASAGLLALIITSPIAMVGQ